MNDYCDVCGAELVTEHVQTDWWDTIPMAFCPNLNVAGRHKQQPQEYCPND